MIATPTKTRNVYPALRSVGRLRLHEVLKFFGWRKRTRTHQWTYGLLGAPEGERYAAWEHVQREHRARIGRAHPDRGGSHEEAATLNAAFDRARELFGRMGIACVVVGLLCGFGCEKSSRVLAPTMQAKAISFAKDLGQCVAFEYPPGIVPADYSWSIEVSTDLVHWAETGLTIEQWGCTPVANNGRHAFFRAKGTR